METSQFCKSCQVLADKTDGVPEYGTIGDRAAVGIFEYVDPKGRKPVSYTKIMKKHNLTREQVLSEAEKYHITIDPEHFVIPINSKRGRPSTKTSESKEPKGAKGRPKKNKKTIEIEGEKEEEDLFATLVEDNTEEVVEEIFHISEEEEEEEKKATEKAEKEAKKAAEKAEKEAKKAAEKAEKEAKKAAEKAEKEAKKAAEKEAKEKAEKEAKEKEAKEKAAKKKKEDVVVILTYENKKYLKSKSSGIVYDYLELTRNKNQKILGIWNEKTGKIDFKKEEEEEEEEEEESEEESEEEED
jgi:hypothetical protein